ncbi:NADH-quinone oxidoreductase subunit H [Methanocorpusculum sp. MG]|uniref:NADH-quinone oxidoreductase subunit H n=1 Tax=Methanocorpusculum petauri TaxID=3002863 RepID=A0ABT4IFI4_9EURY|nr:NADH-quinone oxidoreductase subunit H [Methanocorpusculum petauri]MCZ0860497.1 NADH-quinone oxidoreductase subunit H [Methanocorpusculum petauri]MCZ9311929.1 NADH-quinone oxidoreductase subunit H [Methanocorpusculum sp.]MDE2444237.1 NADH-quinone oxidoreductase subunit H [Methanocorpusculum sp.]
MNYLLAAAGAVLFLILAPLLGGLIAGIDRVLTARMQSRRGPPVLQPFYDISKLWHKERAFANPVEMIFTTGYLVLIAFSGALLFAGGDLLLVVFALALAHTFLILAAYAANAPYSSVGAERELISVMVAEPILILLAAGFFLITGSFFVSDILKETVPPIIYLPGVFLALFAILTLKLRKSPFDISTSHHAHQELVKGVTASLSGRTLAKVEIAHWYETVLILALLFLFFAGNPVLGIIVVVICYFLEILMDNLFPRVTWKMTVKSLWIVTILLGVVNIAVIGLLGGVIG